MAFQYPHLKSETPGAVPLAANMVVGQLAINVADKKFFTKTAAGVVVDITPAVSSGAPTGTKTSALTAATAVAATNEFAVNEAGVSKKVTAAQIKTFVGGGGGGGSNAYSTLIDSSGSHTAGRVAGTYWIGQGDPLGINGVGTLYPPNIIYLAAADYPANGALTAKLRVRLQLFTNDVAPTGNYTFGLYPVTRPTVSGGAGLNIYTLGAVVTGSNSGLPAIAADTMTGGASGDFALPADGYYVIGMVSNATVATSAHIHITASLQIHYT